MAHRMKLLCDLIGTIAYFPYAHEEDGNGSSSSSDADQTGGNGDFDNTALQDVLQSATRAALDTPGRRWKAAGQVKGGEILTIIEEHIQRTGGCVPAGRLENTRRLTTVPQGSRCSIDVQHPFTEGITTVRKSACPLDTHRRLD